MLTLTVGSSDPLPVLGKYQLLRKLATGGMAEVFLARVDGPGGFEKSVVVKRILPHLAEEPNFIAMFLSEARLAAMLNHPNVVQIFDFGEANGSYFLVMEYLDGPNLRALSRLAREAHEPLPISIAVKIVASACEGLAYAHDFADPDTGEPMKLVHRDISPDNIIVARSGSVKVVDFGIAKAANQNNLTKTGTVKGKFAYMAPEQLRGEPLDRRADIFALGMVLNELLTGRKPFDTTNEAVIVRAILYEPLVPATRYRPDISEALQRVLDRALQKDADQRYPDCRALQVDLEQVLAHHGTPVSNFEVAQLIQHLSHSTRPAPSAPRPLAAQPSNRGSLPEGPPQWRPLSPSQEAQAVPVELEMTPNGPKVGPAPELPAVPLLGDLTSALPLATPVASPGAAPVPQALEQLLSETRGAADSASPAARAEPSRGTAGDGPEPGSGAPKQHPRLRWALGAVLVSSTAVAFALWLLSPFPATPSDSPTPRAGEAAQPVVPAEDPARAATERPVPGSAVPPAGLATPVAQEVSPRPATKIPALKDSRASTNPLPGQPREGRAAGLPVAAAPPSPKASPSGPEAFGMVEFRIRPFGLVYVDGAPLGETPFPPQRLRVGLHSVKIVNTDLGREVRATLDVKPGPNHFKLNLEE